MLVSGVKKDDIEKARDFIRQAVEGGAQIIVLPECFSCPYSVDEFRKYSEKIPGGRSVEMLCAEAQRGNVTIIGGTIPEISSDGKIYNSCPVIDPSGRIVSIHRKVHLFDVSIPPSSTSPGITFQESSVLSPGNCVTSFETEYGAIALGVCYDMRFPEYCLAATRDSPDCFLLCFPGAFNMTTGPLHWELVLRSRAVDTQCFICGCAPARGDKGYTSFAHSLVVDPYGIVLVDAGTEECIRYADCLLDRVRQVRSQIPTSRQRRDDLYTLAAAQRNLIPH